MTKEEKSIAEWLCLEHAPSKDRFHLPGISQLCSECTNYAYGIYKDGQAHVIQTIHS